MGCGGPRDPLGRLRPDLPPALASAVDRGLAAAPASRPQTLAALEASLTPLAGSAGKGRASPEACTCRGTWAARCTWVTARAR
jgi:hypothetical protein